MKCKNCIFYTGIECQGHGDYYGECLLFQLFKKTHPKINTTWDIRNDESECYFKNLIKED